MGIDSGLRFCLLGKNIAHSKSQEMYEKILGKNIIYDLIDCPSENDLPTLESLKSYSGISITSPYKEYYLDKLILSKEARDNQAVNSICCKNNKFYGENTDAKALREIFLSMKEVLGNREIILYGSGAMARVVINLLNELGYKFENLSRKLDNFNQYKNQTINSETFIINALSRGVLIPILFKSSDILFDLNYKNTSIISTIQQKIDYIDGEELLLKQAKFSLDFWDISMT